MSNLLYVHDYGDWHVAMKVDAPLRKPLKAFCGALYQEAKPHWASQRHFDAPALVVEDRDVCAFCLFLLPSMVPS